jgi:hypothetical protein
VTVLVVAATHAEVAHVPAGLRVVVTGIGKTASAVGTRDVLRLGEAPAARTGSRRSTPAPGR